jgi:preprotein translocase subunit SecE
MEHLGAYVSKVREFFREVTAEFRRVAWPARREVTGSTTVVLVVVVALAVFLYVVDQVLSVSVQQIFRLVGFRS